MDVISGNTSDSPSLGGIIRERRESMGLTQKQLAAAVGSCSPKTISQYEKGKCPAEVETYFSLAETLRLTPNDIAPKRLMENAASGMGDYARLTVGNKRIVDQLIIGVLKIQNENAESLTDSIGPSDAETASDAEGETEADAETAAETGADSAAGTDGADDEG